MEERQQHHVRDGQCMSLACECLDVQEQFLNVITRDCDVPTEIWVLVIERVAWRFKNDALLTAKAPTALTLARNRNTSPTASAHVLSSHISLTPKQQNMMHSRVYCASSDLIFHIFRFNVDESKARLCVQGGFRTKHTSAFAKLSNLPEKSKCPGPEDNACSL